MQGTAPCASLSPVQQISKPPADPQFSFSLCQRSHTIGTETFPGKAVQKLNGRQHPDSVGCDIAATSTPNASSVQDISRIALFYGNGKILFPSFTTQNESSRRGLPFPLRQRIFLYSMESGHLQQSVESDASGHGQPPDRHRDSCSAGCSFRSPR